MSATWTYQGLGSLQIRTGEPRLYPGGLRHGLRFETTLEASWLTGQETSCALVTGTASLDQPVYQSLGALTPTPTTLRGFDVSVSVGIDLTPDEVYALDQFVDESGLAFRLTLSVTLLAAPEGVHPIAETQVTYRLSRSAWADMLSQAGHGFAVVLRVPGPYLDLRDETSVGAPQPATLGHALRRLHEAKTAMASQNWRECVSLCRAVHETIVELYGPPSRNSLGGRKPASLDKSERLAGMLHAAQTMAHAAHHDDPLTREFRWTRVDAEAVLTTTAALLRAYSAQTADIDISHD